MLLTVLSFASLPLHFHILFTLISHYFHTSFSRHFFQGLQELHTVFQYDTLFVNYFHFTLFSHLLHTCCLPHCFHAYFTLFSHLFLHISSQVTLLSRHFSHVFHYSWFPPQQRIMCFCRPFHTVFTPTDVTSPPLYSIYTHTNTYTVTQPYTHTHKHPSIHTDTHTYTKSRSLI